MDRSRPAACFFLLLHRLPIGLASCLLWVRGTKSCPGLDWYSFLGLGLRLCLVNRGRLPGVFFELRGMKARLGCD